MKRIKTLTNKTMKNTMVKGGCGECQTSCQSACKTSCTVGNQSCENVNNKQDCDKFVFDQLKGTVVYDDSPLQCVYKGGECGSLD